MNLTSPLRRRARADEELTEEAASAELPPIADGAHQTSSALAAKSATVALMTCLALGPVGVVAGSLALIHSSDPPPVQTVAGTDLSNERAIAGEFAQRVVVTWLTSTQEKPDALLALVKGAQISALSTVGFTVTDPTVARIVQVDDIWSVTVAATVTDARTSTERRFYQVPIRAKAGSVTALTLPAPVSPPAVVAGSASEYRTQVGATTAVGATVAQFLAAYIAGSGDVSRYLTPGVSLTALTPAPYTSVRLDEVRATGDGDPAAAPKDGTRMRVLAVGTASVTDKQTSTVAYTLTLTARDGRWEVTAIDLTPAAAPPSTGALSPGVTDSSTSSTTPTP